MNKPSPEVQQRMYEFFMRTSAPRLVIMDEIQKLTGETVKSQLERSSRGEFDLNKELEQARRNAKHIK